MKKNIIKRIICVLMLAALLAFIPSNIVSAKTKYDFDVSLNAGYGQKVLAGYSAPFSITVTNKNNSNFEGYIQLIIPGYSDHNILYEEELALGAGETKTIEIVAGVPVPADFVNVRLTNKKFKVLWEDLQPIIVSKTKNDIRVGVLTDDFSALGYMDRVHFLSDSSRYTSLIELSADTFPTDYAALDLIDVILISDFSTDLLTKEQISALNLWVRKGGLLIIGTGSTANKTLSGLKGSIINENVNPTTEYQTSLGLFTWDYSYITELFGQINSYDPYDGFYDSYYYYDFYSYTDPNNFMDYDGDGLNDFIYNYGGSYTDNGDYYDAYSNRVDPDYIYLYEDDAFFADSNGQYHYKYYDERYGFVYDSLDELLSIYGYSRDEINNIAYSEYCNLWGFDPKWMICEQLGITDEQDLESAFEQYFGDDYEEFLNHYFYLYINYTWNGDDLRPDLSIPAGSYNMGDYKYLSVDCAGLDDQNVRSSDEIIYGDTKSGDTFPLAKSMVYGDGNVVLCAVDFTKNPIPKNSSSGEFFRNIVEKVAGQKLINEAVDYESNLSYSSYYYFSGVGYSDKQLVKSAGNAPVPPLLFYVGVLFIYFVAILVVYFVALKKKKTWNLWIVYPAMSLAAALLIFCLGFSTRVLRLNTNIISLILQDSGVSEETDFINVVVPKSREYVMDFSNEIEIDRNFSLDDASFNKNNDIDYDSYAIRYRTDYDRYQCVVSNKVALESQVFKGEAAYPTQGGLEVTLLSDLNIGGKVAQNIRVTNNYSTVLEDVMVQIYTNSKYEDYYFKKIKPGESVVASAGNNIVDNNNSYSSSYYSPYYNNLKEHYQKNKAEATVMGFLFGNLNKGFENMLFRSGIISYCESEYPPDTDHILVVGFPKSDIGAKVIEGKKSKTKRTEAVILFEDYKDIQVKH